MELDSRLVKLQLEVDDTCEPDKITRFGDVVQLAYELVCGLVYRIPSGHETVVTSWVNFCLITVRRLAFVKS